MKLPVFAFLVGLVVESAAGPAPLHGRADNTTTASDTTSCVTVNTTSFITVPFTTYETSETTLPTITKTKYNSTLLIPSGHSRSINKRSNVEVTPSQSHPTCTSTSAPAACSSTHTFTKTKTNRSSTVTSTRTIEIAPPPVIVRTHATLTTTVPWACASTPYLPHGNGDNGTIIKPVQYPFFALTAVECCLACWETKNCVASGFIKSGLDCELLVIRHATYPNVSHQCPRGIEDYPFKHTHPKGSMYIPYSTQSTMYDMLWRYALTHTDVFPGPCGK